MITSDEVAEVWNVLLFSARLFKQMAAVLAGSAGFVLTEDGQTVQPGTAKVMDRVVDRTRWPVLLIGMEPNVSLVSPLSSRRGQ